MATLTPTLTLVSADATGDSLSLSVTGPLSITTPAISSATISAATAGTVLIASSVSADTYVYLKNTDNTNFVSIGDGAGTPNNLGKLKAKEFAFFPLKGSKGLTLTADTDACVVEYGYWTAS